MADLGIVQHPAKVLQTPAAPFVLPAEADELRELYSRLVSVLTDVIAAHGSRNGMGIAAPQIGVGRSLAIIRPRDGDDICLINPRIVVTSAETDVRFEGCLSFFDVRGKVRRPLQIEVVSADFSGTNVSGTNFSGTNFDGTERRRQFTDDVARLVCHEIDHLDGVLYANRLEEPVIDLDTYTRIKDTCWRYETSEDG